MTDFPIRIPEPLPVKITPCSIIEAIMEIRFVTNVGAEMLPGLLFKVIRDRYPVHKPLPLKQVPEEVRRKMPELAYKALDQFESEGFAIRFGPRVLALATKGAYPGWAKLREEMEWLLERLREADFIVEGERLGLRYIDFFEGRGRLFDLLTVQVMFGDQRVAGPELRLTKILRQDAFKARLLLNDGVTVKQGQTVKPGGILDLDVWLGPDDFELFENGLERFDAAHTLNKQVFFGLIDPGYLSTLNPEYE